MSDYILQLDEISKHEKLALFFENLNSATFEPLHNQPILSFDARVFESIGNVPQDISSLELLLLRFSEDIYFKEKIHEVWLYLPEQELIKDIPDVEKYNSEICSRLKRDLPPLKFIEQASDASALKYLFEKEDIDDVLVLDSLSPLVDLGVMRTMYENHIKYFAEYTFSENIPKGLAGEIAHRTIRHRFSDRDNASQFSLGEIVKKNINSFDIEVYFENPDIRKYRATGSFNDPIQSQITSNILTKMAKIPTYREFAGIILEDPYVQMPHPTYIEIEPVGKCELDCLFCPRHYSDIDRLPMEIPLFDKILAEITKRKIDVSVCLGGMGEPLEHPEFIKLVDKLSANSLVQRIILETNGIHLSEDLFRRLLKYREKLFIIVNLGALDADLYKEIHGKDLFAEVLENLVGISKIEYKKKDLVTIQFLKIKQTEKIIDKFYTFWNEKGFDVLLQKQNTFNGLVEDFRFSDLTPLERIPCWHLKRDLVVQSDGRALICKQDIANKKIIGNFSEDSLEDIWLRGRELAANEALGDFSGFHDCERCDEWYTFNF